MSAKAPTPLPLGAVPPPPPPPPPPRRAAPDLHDHRASPPVALDLERGRCGSCRWWLRDGSRRWGECRNELIADERDPAYRGVMMVHGGPLVTGDRFGCVHWSGVDCPTCGQPRRAA